MDYKLLLLTSGVGSRLGEMTEYTNKSLIRVGTKPSISYIIEMYPVDIEIVVTLGYYGEQVKDFLLLTYPNRKFNFVNVGNYCGEGSSLIYSLLCAENKINKPFIFHTCDTIIQNEHIPSPSFNWLGGYIGTNSANYASITVLDDMVVDIYPKGQVDFTSLYIGLAGIFNYKEFFELAKNLYKNNKNDSQLSDIHVTPLMINNGFKFKHIQFKSWIDIGNVDQLNEARKKFPSINVLDKNKESIFIFNDKVIKFFYDKNIICNRVIRNKELEGLVPKIINCKCNFYSYEFVEGDLLCDIINEKEMSKFMEWSFNNLWIKKTDKSKKQYKRCKEFYFIKTLKRVKDFLNKHNFLDEENIINGENIPTLKVLLSQISEKYLCDVPSYRFHGDYILDNILKIKDGYCLLDWRQDFAGDLKNGDIYYDFGKLNHNLIFNHKIIRDGNYIIKKNGSIKVDLLISKNLQDCRNKMLEIVREKGFDTNKIELISSIIWLNMSPLHNYPLDIFLYYFGKYNLYKCLKSIKGDKK